MKTLKYFFFTLSSLCCFLFFGSFREKAAKQIVKPSFSDTVSVSTGFVSGEKSNDGEVTVFKGIPFAAPPLGELRWKAPQPPASWQGVKTCLVFGPSPMQAKPAPFSMWSEEFLIPKEPIAEDCLYLNVWTGAKSKRDKKPVLVWIYGGGFSSGGSGVPIYDGEAMAKKGIVFVSFNYRVGIFGFFAHPELTKESGKNASGNYGLMDQIAALQWVQKNIASFGGDPANVTIAGQSAGSMSVNYLVASPLAKGLFTKAIAESGANFSRGSTTLKEAEEAGEKVLQTLKVSNIAEARNIPAEDLLKTAGQGRPDIDGYVVPDEVANIFASGKQNKVGLLTGWNEDEGLLFGPVKSAVEFRKEAEQRYGSDVDTFLKFYPATTDSQAAVSQLKLSRDMIFGVQNFTWANMESRDPKTRVYLYRFARKVPATGEYVKYGAFHTGEVPYAYDNLRFVNRPWQAVDHELAATMSTYWANFITSGNPNGEGLSNWPAYTEKEKRVMIFNTRPQIKQLPDANALEFIALQIKSN